MILAACEALTVTVFFGDASCLTLSESALLSICSSFDVLIAPAWIASHSLSVMSTWTFDLDAPTFALAAVKACWPARLISSAVQSGLAACFCFNVLLAIIWAWRSFGAFCNALLSLEFKLATSDLYTDLAWAFNSMFLVATWFFLAKLAIDFRALA